MSTSTSSATTPAVGPDAQPADGPHGSADDSQKWFAKHQQLNAKQGAWDDVQRSFRFSPRPYRWRDVLLTAGILYGLFIGLPAAAGLWAAWRIWQETRG